MSIGGKKQSSYYRRTREIKYHKPREEFESSRRTGFGPPRKDRKKKTNDQPPIEVFDPYYRTGFGPPRDNKRREIYSPQPKDKEVFDPSYRTGFGPPATDIYPGVEPPTVKGLFYMLVAGVLLLVGSFVCGLLVLIGLILAMVGFFKIYGDRDSYPEPHITNMKQSFYFYLIGFVIIIIASIIIIISVFSLFTLITGATDISSAFDSFLFYLVLGAILGTVGELFRLVGRYKLLVGLLPSERIGFLKIAVILAVGASLISLVLVPIIFNDLRGSFESADTEEDDIIGINRNYQYEKEIIEFQEKTQPITIISGGFGFLIQLFFIYCFYIAYDNQKKNPHLRKDKRSLPIYHYKP